MGFWKGIETDEGYEVSTAHRWFKPRKSGNAINGLGETEQRPPKVIYHVADQGKIFPHFLVNIMFLINTLSRKGVKPHLTKAISNDKKAHKPDTSKPAVEKSPEAWTAAIKEFALANGADLVGIARIDPMWVFEGMEKPGEYAIMLGFQMEHAELKKLPYEDEGHVEVLRVYGNGAETASKLAKWLADQGHRADGRCFQPGALNYIPTAISAGLGQLGKHGSLINPELGSGIRLAAVTVDMPLISDESIDFHLDEFCLNCQMCTKACPPNAMGSEKQLVRGVEKWYVDFDKCIPFFNDTSGCGTCLSACPFTLPGRAPIIVSKLQKKHG